MKHRRRMKIVMYVCDTNTIIYKKIQNFLTTLNIVFHVTVHPEAKIPAPYRLDKRSDDATSEHYVVYNLMVAYIREKYGQEETTQS